MSETVYLRVEKPAAAGRNACLVGYPRAVVWDVIGDQRAVIVTVEVEALRTQLAEEVRLRKLRKALDETVIEAESAIKADALREAAQSIADNHCHCTPNMSEGNGQCGACDIVDSLRYDADQIEGGGDGTNPGGEAPTTKRD